ncbi:lyase family protein [Streptomyces sodiiphilus]|uniref:Lyase family protein n=1 Tax=Streptomyces sodiiphilus TaxID=226217 RepID=A0ABN2NTE4_9ACTN
MNAEDILPADPDTGLLSPVRAGTSAEAAVSDTAWVQAMLDAEAALARAQARIGTVPEHAARTITRVARADELDIRRLAVLSRETANPVVGLIRDFTGVVAAADPAAAPYVHFGSTSQDVLDTGAMLVASRSLGLLAGNLRRTADACGRLAGRHRDTAMPGRTLALHAVPTTFGLKAAGWYRTVLEAAERTEAVRAALPVSLGGAAGTLAGYLEKAGVAAGSEPPADYPDRLLTAFAAEAGLARPVLPWHALRAPVADLGSLLAHVTGVLGKIAVDVQVLVRTEVGEAAEPAVTGRGASSAMPQKRNPVLSTLIRSASLQVPALASVLTSCLLTEDERSGGAWHAEWQPLRECLRLAGGAAHTAVELTEGLTVDPGRMRSNLGLTGGQVVSERLAAHLAPVLGRAEAGRLLTGAAVRADREGVPFAEVLAGLPQLRALFGEQQITELLDPERYTGAARQLVDRALATAGEPDGPGGIRDTRTTDHADDSDQEGGLLP